MPAGVEDDGAIQSIDAVSRRRLGWILALSLITAIGLLMPPFGSDDAFQPMRDLMSRPSLAMAGGVLIVVASLVGLCDRG